LPVYLHVDVDIMDSTEMPGLRFPAGRGPTLGDVENCLTEITATADVVAATLACAWLPGQVSGPRAREAIVRLAGALGTQLTWPPADTQATIACRRTPRPRRTAGSPGHRWRETRDWRKAGRPPTQLFLRRSPDGSGDFADADQSARGVAEGAVADAVWLLGRLLDDLGAAALHPPAGASNP